MNSPVPTDSGQPTPVLVRGVRETLPLVVRLNPWRYAWAGARPLFFWLPLLFVPVGLLRFPHLFLAARRGPVLGLMGPGSGCGWCRPG